LKMELTEGSETSANHNLTPGKYPKEYIQNKFRLYTISQIDNQVLNTFLHSTKLTAKQLTGSGRR
jgi:hypothetical protein